MASSFNCCSCIDRSGFSAIFWLSFVAETFFVLLQMTDNVFMSGRITFITIVTAELSRKFEEN